MKKHVNNTTHDIPTEPSLASFDIPTLQSNETTTSANTSRSGVTGPILSIEPEVFYIERVLEYHPRKGYLVHWKGFGDADRSWQNGADMPPELKDEMKKARVRYSTKSSVIAVDTPADLAQPPFYNELIAKRKMRPTSVPAIVDEETGDKKYVISRVLAYLPDKGYLVSWVGFADKYNSWQLSSDMPAELSEEMRKTRDVHWAQQSIVKVPLPETKEKTIKSNLRTKVVKSDISKTLVATVVQELLPVGTIASIAAYDPAQGFLVRWENKPDRFNVWLPETEIPASFRAELNSVRDRYYILPVGEDSVAKRVCPSEEAAAIHSILRYDPNKGYLVHCKGTRSTNDSWMPIVPEGFRFQALLARERWDDDQLNTVSIVTPDGSPVTTPRPTTKETVPRVEEEEFEIEAVLSHHPSRGYLVKWVGYPQPTWQKAQDMPRTCRAEMNRVAQEYKQKEAI